MVNACSLSGHTQCARSLSDLASRWHLSCSQMEWGAPLMFRLVLLLRLAAMLAPPHVSILLTGENTLTIDHDRFVVVDRKCSLVTIFYDPSLD